MHVVDGAVYGDWDVFLAFRDFPAHRKVLLGPWVFATAVLKADQTALVFLLDAATMPLTE